MRRHALTMGAAVLAAVPVALYGTIPAMAIDDYELDCALDQWINSYWEIVESPEFLALSPAAIGMFDYVDAAVITSMYCGWKNGHPADMATITCFNGLYIDARDGKTYNGAIFGRTTETQMPDGWTVFAGASGTIELTPRDPAKYINCYAMQSWCVKWGGYYYANGAPSVGSDPRFGAAYYSSGDIPTIDLSHPAELLPDGGASVLIANSRRNYWTQGFPSAVLEDYDDVVEYINPIIEEAVDSYPELAPFMPDTTPPPVYPVQETWAEDADWPEGNLLPTIPAASYSVDIPEIMTEGAAFWWRCLGVLFDGLGITAVVVGLLALGIVLYFVLR